jgi:hypothetical protein
MSEKGFESEITLDETPSIGAAEDKPLKGNIKDQSKKVDINVLKARVQALQSKENKKNISIFILFITILGGIGVFLSA